MIELNYGLGIATVLQIRIVDRVFWALDSDPAYDF